MFRIHLRSREARASIRKRLALGLLMALFSIVTGWLMPPEVGTDQATANWYSQ